MNPFIFDETMKINVVFVSFFLVISVFVVTSATKPPKSLSYKYQLHLFGSGSMKGLCAVSFSVLNLVPNY